MRANLFVVLSLSAGIALLAGCGKDEQTPAGTTSTTPTTAESVTKAAGEAVKTAVDTASTEAKKAVETVKTNAEQIAKDASAQVKTAVDGAASKFDSLYQQAKSYVAEKKYQDSLSVIQQLSNLKLTPEQQKLVDDLKAQVQKLIGEQATKEATSTLNNILGGKK